MHHTGITRLLPARVNETTPVRDIEVYPVAKRDLPDGGAEPVERGADGSRSDRSRSMEMDSVHAACCDSSRGSSGNSFSSERLPPIHHGTIPFHLGGTYTSSFTLPWCVFLVYPFSLIQNTCSP